MSNHLFVFNMSTIPEEPETHEYTSYIGDFKASCTYTNETGFRFVFHELKKQNADITKAFAFTTQKVVSQGAIGILLKELGKENIPLCEVPLEDKLLEKALESMEEMYEKIIEQIKESKEETIVHVDITGGRRHSAMMMLGLVRLLKYSNIKLGYVIYTNFDTKEVENALDLMRIFSSISGAEEFANYGHIYQLATMYQDGAQEVSGALKGLLKSMKNVSEVLITCGDPQVLNRYLKEMKQYIDNYKQSRQTTPNEIFFKMLLPTITESYKSLLASVDTKQTFRHVVSWCLERKLLQQAVTFFTDWAPMYLAEAKIVQQISDKRQKACKTYMADSESAMSDRNKVIAYYCRYYPTKVEKPYILKEKGGVKKFFLNEINEKQLTIKMNEQNFLNFMELYHEIRREWRNKINHGANRQASEKSNQELEKLLRRAIGYLPQ